MKNLIEYINEDNSLEEQVKAWDDFYDEWETHMLDDHDIQISDDNSGYVKFLNTSTKVKEFNNYNHLKYGIYMVIMDMNAYDEDHNKFIKKQMRKLKKAGIKCVRHDDDICVTHPIFRKWYQDLCDRKDELKGKEKKEFDNYDDIHYSYM